MHSSRLHTDMTTALGHPSDVTTGLQIMVDSQLDPGCELGSALQEWNGEIFYITDGLQAQSCKPDVYIVDLMKTSKAQKSARLSKVQTQWPTAIVVAVSDTALPETIAITHDEQLVIACVGRSVDLNLLANLVRGIMNSNCLSSARKENGESMRRQRRPIRDALVLTGHECWELLNELVLASNEILHITDDTPNSEARTAMKGVRQSAVSMRCAINNHLNLTRLENDKLIIHPTLIDPVRDILEPVLAGYDKLLAARKQTYQMRVNRPGLLIWADKALLINVYDNLIHNVFAFGEPGGIVTFSVMERGNVDEFSVWSRGQAPNSRCLEYLAYGNSDVTRRNAEIGMYLAGKIIEIHGGRLGIEAQAGGWMNFIFTLPKREVASRDRTMQASDFCFNLCL